MIFTLPPVEVSGILAWLASDICREHHASPNRSYGTPMESLLDDGVFPSVQSCEVILTMISPVSKTDDNGAQPRGPPRVLGMVTLSDIPRLEAESAKGDGWIACR